MSFLFYLSYPKALLSYIAVIHIFIYGIFGKQNTHKCYIILHHKSIISIFDHCYRVFMGKKGLLNQKAGVYIPLCLFFPVASNPSNILWETKCQFSPKGEKSEGWLELGSSEFHLTTAHIVSVSLILSLNLSQILFPHYALSFYYVVPCECILSLVNVTLSGLILQPVPVFSVKVPLQMFI